MTASPDDLVKDSALSELGERELTEQAKADPRAFGRLYELHYQPILNYLYRRTLSVTVAEELTSNTFFKALRGLGGYRAESSFRAWLYRIATNEIRMHWRRLGGQRGRDEDHGLQEDLRRIHFARQGPEPPGEAEERLRRYAELHRLLLTLPEHHQTAIVLRYFEGFSHAEIAKTMHKRLSTVKSYIHRGLKKLRRQLQRQDATFSPAVHLPERAEGVSDDKET